MSPGTRVTRPGAGSTSQDQDRLGEKHGKRPGAGEMSSKSSQEEARS
jgi:hypothetical protein